MKKSVTVTHFAIKIVPICPYITCIKKILFDKKYLSLLWVFTNFSILLVVSEHKHCKNMATNSNSESARSRDFQGSVGTGTKEDESSTGRMWAPGFHHVTARSRLTHVLKLMNCLFL